MPFGLAISLLCHAALIGWALLTTSMAPPLPELDTPAISAELITPSEFLRLKQGDEDSKRLETKSNEEPKPDDSKNDTKKPDNAPAPPPPPEREVAKVEEPAPPEPPKPDPPKPDPIAKKIEEAPPPLPEPAGPTPDEQKLLEQKIEDERKAEEAKKKAEEEAKKKAEEEAKKKAEEEKKKKLAEEAKKKKLAEQKRKAEEAKKKFDPSKIASLLDKAKDDAPQKALLDKDPQKKGQQASGTRDDALAVGREAGTATGADSVLSLREQDLLKGMLKAQLNGCWRPPGTGGGSEVPVVSLSWEMNPDGTLRTEPKVTAAPSTAAGQVYAEAALRAVKTCVPFRLPPDKYEGGWRYIDWTFDPRELL